MCVVLRGQMVYERDMRSYCMSMYGYGEISMGFYNCMHTRRCGCGVVVVWAESAIRPGKLVTSS